MIRSHCCAVDSDAQLLSVCFWTKGRNQLFDTCSSFCRFSAQALLCQYQVRGEPAAQRSVSCSHRHRYSCTASRWRSPRKPPHLLTAFRPHRSHSRLHADALHWHDRSAHPPFSYLSEESALSYAPQQTPAGSPSRTGRNEHEAMSLHTLSNSSRPLSKERAGESLPRLNVPLHTVTATVKHR